MVDLIRSLDSLLPPEELQIDSSYSSGNLQPQVSNIDLEDVKDVINSLLEGVHQFHEQLKEKKVQYHPTIHPSSKAAKWKGSLACAFDNTIPEAEMPPLQSSALLGIRLQQSSSFACGSMDTCQWLNCIICAVVVLGVMSRSSLSRGLLKSSPYQSQ
ncbi:hypothetical protein Ancab_022422 [Ancistrocladus abbreviatus]